MEVVLADVLVSAVVVKRVVFVLERVDLEVEVAEDEDTAPSVSMTKVTTE